LSHACGTCVSELFILIVMLKFDCQIKQMLRYPVIENKFPGCKQLDLLCRDRIDLNTGILVDQF
jgi:hypothetical protein